jgi:hypothetical protein
MGAIGAAINDIAQVKEDDVLVAASSPVCGDFIFKFAQEIAPPVDVANGVNGLGHTQILPQ